MLRGLCYKKEYRKYMKDFVNPFLLLVTVGLTVWVLQGGGDDSSLTDPALWLLVLCVTGCVVNGALCLARSFARRPMLMAAVWSMVYLIIGSVGWVYVAETADSRRDWSMGYASLRVYAETPYQTDEAGECLLTYAAGLGKVHAVKQYMGQGGAVAQPELFAKAALRAAEAGQLRVLDVLVPAAVAVEASAEGMPLLVGAAVNGRLKSAEKLLSLGAPVNAADADGNTALMHAAVNGDTAMAKLLLQHGADVKLRNCAGQSAADSARGGVAELLH